MIRARAFQQVIAPYERPKPELPEDMSGLLWVIGVDPGATTGVALLAIPYLSIFGDAPGGIEWAESFELTGSLQAQVSGVTYVARLVASRSDSVPPLIVCEDFDLGGNRLSGSASTADVIIPARLGAALQFAVECGQADRAALDFQGRTLAFTTAKDERLKAWGLWVKGSDHERDARRHAITMIRRIASGSIKASEVWLAA